MIEVRQTKFGELEGNCFQACLASIMELNLENIPDFNREKSIDWLTSTNFWLLNFDLFLFIVVKPKSFVEWPHAYHLIGGKSPRGNYAHSVVGYRGKIIFDPHPSDKGLERITDHGFFIVRHPHLQQRDRD